MTFKDNQPVKLKHDLTRRVRIPAGMVGTVVCVFDHADAYEVELCGDNGVGLLVTVKAEEIEAV